MRDWDNDWVCVQRDALQEIVQKQQLTIEKLRQELANERNKINEKSCSDG